MDSMKIVGVICGVFLILTLAYSEFKKAFKADVKHTEAEAIHWGLLSVMPGICEGEYTATDRSMYLKTSRYAILGEYNGNKFSFRFNVSGDKGHHVMTGIDKEDDQIQSILAADRFTEVYIIKERDNDKFIKRLTRWSCGVIGRN